MRGLIARVLRLPIRARITLISAVAMGCLFGILGVLLNVQFQSSLNTSINTALRARAAELSALGARFKQPVPTIARQRVRNGPESYAQILDRRGEILAASAGYDRTPLLYPREIRIAFAGPMLIDRGEGSRLYAQPAPGGRLVVVGVSLNQQQDAFITFNWELVAGIPTMLVLASLITYLMAGRLLSPVEKMRQQAATISAEDLNGRLPLPASVDEICRLAITLNEMLDRLHAGLERERRFVADASHELRSPLAVLKGELEVALRANGSAAEWREAVSSAVEETDRVINLAEDLLILAGAQRGALPLSRTAIDTRQVLTETAERISQAAARELREVVIRCDQRLAFVGDPTRIRQALDNIADNALRHGNGTVTLSARRENGCVELHVTDEGPGFPDEFLPHAFERFTRADPARSRGSTGLGLSITDTIARAHDGAVHAANRSRGGADVWISLPVHAPSDTAIEPVATSA